MGHLLISMWIKNILIKILSLFYNFQILQYLHQKYVLKFLGKVMIIKASAGFKLMTYRLALTHCTTLLVNYYVKEKVYTVILDVIVYFDRK